MASHLKMSMQLFWAGRAFIPPKLASTLVSWRERRLCQGHKSSSDTSTVAWEFGTPPTAFLVPLHSIQSLQQPTNGFMDLSHLLSSLHNSLGSQVWLKETWPPLGSPSRIALDNSLVLILHPGRTVPCWVWGYKDRAGTALCLRGPWLRKQP